MRDEAPPTARLREAAVRLTGRLLETAGRGVRGFQRLESPVASAGSPSPDLLDCLECFRSSLRIYWADREGNLVLAGAGAALVLEASAWERLDSPLRLLGLDPAGEEAARLRWIGAGRFDPAGSTGPKWAGFGRCRIHLPLVELRRDREGLRLACNLPLQEQEPAAGGEASFPDPGTDLEEARRLLEDLISIPGSPGGSYHPATLEYGSTTSACRRWREQVEELHCRFERGGPEKVVLSRVLDLRADRPLNPFELLRRLRRAQPDSYRFLIQSDSGDHFFGASPERLYRRGAGGIESEALAGTRPRARESVEDRRLAQELLNSPKELREQAMVEEWIRERLQDLGCRIEAAEGPALRRLARVQHLCTRIIARPERELCDRELLAGLHPSPAVCGLPTGAALAEIRRLEDFDRGHFAGPLGCFGAESSEVAVAIRSALLKGRDLRLFAGAGILPDSRPDAEWEETGNKMQLLRMLLEESTFRAAEDPSPASRIRADLRECGR